MNVTTAMSCVNLVSESDVFAGFMMWAVARRNQARVVRSDPLCISLCVSFVSFAAGRDFKEPGLTPERQSDQARHIERCAGRGNRGDEPQDPSPGNIAGRGSAPQDLV